MVRQLAFFLLIAGIPISSVAQKTFDRSFSSRFIFGAGPGIYMADANNSTAIIPAVELSPMYIVFSRWSDFSVSINSRPTFGYNIKNDVLPSNFFFTDIPITGELNLGHGSTKDFYSLFGFFGGAGYGWQIYNGSSQAGGAYTGGFRTWLGPLATTFRYTYVQTNSFQGTNMHRVSVSFALGRWVKKVKQMNRISKFVKPGQ